MAYPMGGGRLERELAWRAIARVQDRFDAGGWCTSCHKPRCYGDCIDKAARHAAVAARPFDFWDRKITSGFEQFGWCPPNPWGAAGSPGGIH